LNKHVAEHHQDQQQQRNPRARRQIAQRRQQKIQSPEEQDAVYRAHPADIETPARRRQRIQSKRRRDQDQLRGVDAGNVMILGVVGVLGGGVAEFVFERRAKIESRDQLAEVSVVGDPHDRR
jgi:sRNA-binding protein